MKRRCEDLIKAEIYNSYKRLPRYKEAVFLSYKWYEPNDRRDSDNIVFAQKFVQDAFVSLGILPDDNRKYISGFSHLVYVDKENPRIEVTITPKKGEENE